MSNSSILRRVENPDSGIRSGNNLAFDPDGGVELASVRTGAILEVQTKNTCYTMIPQGTDEVLIWGHPQYCPEPVRTKGLGSAYVTGVFRQGYLGLGMRLSFRIGDRHITTSRILKIQLKPQN
jgi:hypothetical protein